MSSTVLSQENLIGAASANATEMFVEPKRTSVYSILESTSETEVKIHGAALAIFLSCVGKFLFILSWILICLTFPFSLIFAMRIVAEYERAVIFRLGKLLGPRGPGLFFILPCVDTYHRIDLRVLSFDIPPQELLSKDSVTVSVDAAVYFRVHDPIISVTNINDAFASTKLLAQTTLRNVFGTKNLTQMLSEREEMSRLMRTILDEATFDWGVKYTRRSAAAPAQCAALLILSNASMKSRLMDCDLQP